MATSGTFFFAQTAAQLIQSAHEDIGLIEAGGTASSADKALALSRLNTIVKQLGRNDGSGGLKVHVRQRITLMLAKGQQSYLVGPASSDARASTAIGRTTISANEAAAQTTISITSNTDTTTYPGTTITMTASDIVGIELNDGTIQWTTISGTPSSTMDIAAGLTGAANAGNYVYWFTSRAQRFPYIEAATLRDENYKETPLDIYTDARQYQLGVADKYADSSPSCILVEPLRIATRVTCDAQPNDVTKQIILTVWYPSENYDADTNDIAFPQEALEFLRLELMFKLAPSIGRWTPEMEKSRQEARAMYFSLNPENSVAYFEPGGIE